MTERVFSPAGSPLLLDEPPLRAMHFGPATEEHARALIIGPLFDEKRCAHRALVRVARALAARGVETVAPDLTGTGNSPLGLDAADAGRWLADVCCASALFDTADCPLRVVGVRAGALLVAHALAAGGIACERLILIQPTTSGKAWLGQARTRRMVQDAVTGGDRKATAEREVEGEVLPAVLYDWLAAATMPDSSPAEDVVVLQWGPAARISPEYQRLAESWGLHQRQVTALTGLPFWQPHTPSAYAELCEAVVEACL